MWSRYLLVFAMLLVVMGCRSDNEQISDVVRNFIEADKMHAAPQRAYTYLSDEDKAHMPVEGFAKSREGALAFDEATFTIDSIEMAPDRAVVKVTYTESPGSEDTETTYVVTEQSDRKYRVYLGLKQISDIRAKIDNAERLADDGALEKAKEIMEQIASSPFRGSQPEIYEREIASAKKNIERRESRKSLDNRMGDAMKMSVTEMEQEISEIAKLIPDDDEQMKSSFAELEKEYENRLEKQALDDFVFTDVKVRRVVDDWGLVRTVLFKARNNTKRPLSALKVEVRFVNEKGGEALGRTEFDLIAKGKTMENQATIPFEKDVKTIPQDWKGRQVEVVAIDLVFADGK